MTRYEHERQGKVRAAWPAYGVLCLIRGYGYSETHLAAIPAGSIVVLCEDADVRADRIGAASPVAGICGTRVRSAQPFVVIEASRIRCTGREVPPPWR
jgi:hypothetical protein